MHFPLGEARRAVAVKLLEQLVGHSLNVVDEVAVGHDWAPVTRLVMTNDLPWGGNAVIVKTRRVDGEGYGGPLHARREQVGLELAAGSGVTPTLLGADEATGVTVMSDAGKAATLETLLLRADAAQAEAAFVSFARAVGRLHAATTDVESRHRAALTGFGVDPVRERLGQWPGVDAWTDIEAAARDLGFPDGRRARGDVADVKATLLEPSPFGALVHGDLNPTNVLVLGNHVTLVDFEGSTFGHIGVDASFVRYPFPNYSNHWSVLPDAVVHAAEAAYRAELSGVLRDEWHARFDEMMAIGSAATLVVRVRRLRKVADDDESTHNRWRRRAQLVQQIRVFTQLCDRAGTLADLSQWFADLADAMASRWPDATQPPPPLFPAFDPQLRSATVV